MIGISESVILLLLKQNTSGENRDFINLEEQRKKNVLLLVSGNVTELSKFIHFTKEGTCEVWKDRI